MRTKERLRTETLNKFKKLSADKLPKLDIYLSDLEKQLLSEKSPLAFSGIFEELELDDLTVNLHKIRGSEKNRVS